MPTIITMNENGQTERVEVEAGSMLAPLQHAVEGLIERVELDANLDMWVNEEGLYTFGPERVNPVASEFMRRAYGQGYLRGPVAFTGGADDEGNTLGLTAEQVQQIETLASTLRARLVVI